MSSHDMKTSQKKPFRRWRGLFICCSALVQMILAFSIQETGFGATRIVVLVLGMATWFVGLSFLINPLNQHKMEMIALVLAIGAIIILGGLFIMHFTQMGF